MHCTCHTAGFRCIVEQSDWNRPQQVLGSPRAWSAILRGWKHRLRLCYQRGQISGSVPDPVPLETALWQKVLSHEKPGPLEMGPFYHQTPRNSRSQHCLQSSIWVLIVSWHHHYVDCSVLRSLSPPDFIYVIRPKFVELLSITRYFRSKWALNSQPPNQYQSDHKSESRR